MSVFTPCKDGGGGGGRCRSTFVPATKKRSGEESDPEPLEYSIRAQTHRRHSDTVQFRGCSEHALVQRGSKQGWNQIRCVLANLRVQFYFESENTVQRVRSCDLFEKTTFVKNRRKSWKHAATRGCLVFVSRKQFTKKSDRDDRRFHVSSIPRFP